MKIIKLFVLVGVILTGAVLSTNTSHVKASEATVELVSTTKENYRCFASSLLVGDYKVLVGCSDLIYPSAGPYILWATPIDDSSPLRLGTLDYGRKLFSTRVPFSILFVTLEDNPKAKSPSGPVIMKGSTQPIEILRESPAPTPESESDDSEDKAPKDQEADDEKKSSEEEEEETKELSTKEKIYAILRRAGVAAFFALIAIIGLIFVITRAK